MILLVKWHARNSLLWGMDELENLPNGYIRFGIWVAQYWSPEGTRVCVAPIGDTKPDEVLLSNIEWVVNPSERKREIQHALKDLRKGDAK